MSYFPDGNPSSFSDLFACFCVTPAALCHAGLAIATVRAGGIGILDWEFCSDAQRGDAERNLQALSAIATASSRAIGVRLVAAQALNLSQELQMLNTIPHWLVLSGWESGETSEVISALPAARSRRLLLEVTDITQLRRLRQWQDTTVDGLIARGHESGGWGSADSAFLLTQKLLQQSELPVYVQGGIGVQTAAACRAAGAAGVVLDNQLWLMPESPLSQDAKQHLSNLNGQEAVLIGERLGQGCRVLSRPGFAAVVRLQDLAEQIEVEIDAPEQQIQQWRERSLPLLGWGDPNVVAWPIGQEVGLAAQFRDRYRTTGRLVQALLQSSKSCLEIAQRLQPLQAGSALAQSHRTLYPIVQGPMTRVSDSAAFAESVAQSGALPMLALALMRGSQVRQLLQDTKALLGDRSWGVGILGFVPQQLREVQLEIIREVKPPFALIAGGRPDQAAQLESQGIATYIHVPTASLLKLFLQQGSRRFVFEGRECGGHVGPLSSFMLWESVVHTLMEEVADETAAQVHVLFAGGIHDARSTAMVTAIAAPLAERGMKLGVLMGTAYLFTEEAVRHGAIVKEFQQVAISCQSTINLETGPGHASRCAVTPFAKEFYETRRRLRRENRSSEEIKNQLENLTLGRLRVASKGLVRGSERILEVDVEQQRHDGMYMIGQVATLRSQVCKMAQLHEDVSMGSTALIAAAQSISTRVADAPSAPADVAIIGMATLLPKAQNPETFWSNIVEKVDAISEIPPQRWDWRLYYDPDRRAEDKIYSKWGGFLEDVSFDPMRFGIPPKSLKSIEPMQLMTLEAVRRALEDAGYEDGNFDRERTCVILGAGGGVGDIGQQYALRSGLPLVVEDPSAEVWDRLPEWTEESFPGLLLNVAAGRVANRFDLRGTNYTVDAACASSLAAVSLAVRDLESGRSNVAIAGGIDAVQNPLAYMCFSKTQALSPFGRPLPFDQSADGIAISEGIAIVVMKRLVDAERDGDRIYAVIKAVEGSSDGKALGMTAPRAEGQRLAVRRAYEKAGFSPATLGLYEAHGTGTAAGDRSELETIATTLTDAQAPPNACVLGSVKSLIGHTKSTAGVAGLIKAALALYYRVRPGHANVTTPLAELSDPKSPVCLLQNSQPWLMPLKHPRRASVSAFGFGGTNFHALLEEHCSSFPHAPGGNDWTQELLAFRGAERESLLQELQHLSAQIEMGAEPCLRDLAFSYAQRFERRQGAASLCIVAVTLEELQSSLKTVTAYLNRGAGEPLPPHIQLNLQTPDVSPKVAFLFPGQGAQYPEMARSVALYWQEMREAIESADRLLQSLLPQPLSQYIFPAGAFSEAEENRQQQQLMDTRIAQPAIGAVEMGFMAIARRLNLQADAACGHSYGEYAALHYAGALSQADFLRLSAERGRVMAQACDGTDGGMAAIQASRELVQVFLKDIDGVIIANYNSPLQTVISGSRDRVAQVVERINASGTLARMLPVAGAFHSTLVASAQAALAEAINSVDVYSTKIPVYSNASARPYAIEPEAIRQQLVDHLISPVNFIGQIESMYEAGMRVFLELGPRSILTNLTRQILDKKEVVAISLGAQGNGLSSLLIALGNLAVAGVPLQLTALYRDRPSLALNLSQLATTTRPVPLSPTTWLVNGGSARPQTESVGYSGKLPLLTLETAAIARMAKGQADAVLVVPEDSRPPSQPQRQADSQSTIAPVALSLTPATQSTIQLMTQLPPTSANDSDNGAMAAQQPLPSISLSTETLRLQAFQSYQTTMQQFLTLQERVISQFLSRESTPEPQATTPVYPQKLSLSPQHFSAASPSDEEAKKTAPHSVIATPRITSGDQVVPFPTAGLHPVPQAEIPQNPALELTLRTVTPAPQSAPPSVATLKTDLNAKALDRSSLTQMLLELVSDRTGYPTEMLGLDQDIEAELGIDSIKRVEILGTLQKSLPTKIGKTVQSQMENLTRVKTLGSLADKLLEFLSTQQAEAVPAAESGPSAGDNPLERAGLTQMLLELVSDRTGYPTDMLGLDQDIEAELGIDSIKRVEILGTLQKSLTSGLGASMQAQMENLTRVKTLNGLLDKLLELTAKNSTKTQQEDVCLGKSSGTEDVPRLTMQAMPQSLPATASIAPVGLYLITEDALGVAALVANALQKRGANVEILSTEILQVPDSLEQAIAVARQRWGSVSAIVHLAPLKVVGVIESAQTWRQETRVQVKSLFQLLQACADNLQQAKSACVLSASLLGGYFGRVNHCGSGSLSGGASTGLLKTLSHEWPQVQFRALDCDESQLPEAIAEQILQELLLAKGNVEVGYPQGQRTLFPTVATPIAQGVQQLHPQADWVVLVSGGNRGITAEVMKAWMVPGMTLIVVGRSPEPPPESPATRDITDVDQLRRVLLEQIRSEGVSSSPAQTEKALQSLLNARATRATLQWFRQQGKVDYRAVDVKDPQSFAELIDAIYARYGHLDAVIHGAGMIEDKLLIDKTPDSFERVFDTKADSAFTLSRNLRFESLKLLVFFSSVAGRYGSRGQCDYAAANEVVNRLAWQLHWQWPSTRVISINWGPWDTTGMASEGVKRQFRERGIIPISLESGCRFFLKEVLSGGNSDVEVISGKGPWSEIDRVEVPKINVLASENASIIADFPLLLGQPQLQPNGTVTLQHTFSLSCDPYLGDHRLDGKPVLPATVGAEWLAEFVQAAWPDMAVAEIRDLRIMQGIVLPPEGKLPVLLCARASTHADSTSLQVAAELLDISGKRPLHQATVCLQPQLSEAAIDSSASLSSGRSLDPQAAYRNYLFHGLQFQLAIAIDSLSPEGIDAQVMPSRPSVFKDNASVCGNWLFDPGLMDVAPQLAIVWARVLHDTTPLPSRFGRIVRYGSQPLTEILQLRLRIKDFTGHSLTYDAVFVDASGCIRLEMLNIEGACSTALNRLTRSGSGEQVTGNRN